jgi:hypothetical protein
MKSFFDKVHLLPVVIFSFLFLNIFPAHSQAGGGIVISEIMASNNETVVDEDGDYPDWIELYNSGSESVNLEGWGLSDDALVPFQWVFPRVTILPGEQLIVWASDKDRRSVMDEPEPGIVREVYLNIPGSDLEDLTGHSSFPGNPSSREVITDYFEAPINFADEYGQRMHGILEAPQSGEYTFWISGDDNSRLFLSMDEDPNQKELIAEVPIYSASREWDHFPEQQSDPVNLNQGERYYICALMKEGIGGDHLALRWQLPDGTFETPLNASHVYQVGGMLHTNFAISSDGEPIILTNASGENVQFVNPVTLPTDVSYGRPNDTGSFVFFEDPTPGNSNPAQGYSEIISETPAFSHTGGFYSNAFDLTISTTIPGAEIYYTLDGSEPDPNNTLGTIYNYSPAYPTDQMQSREIRTHKYTGFINIDDRSDDPYELASINTKFSSSASLPDNNIFKGTVIRAKIVKDGAITTKTATHTFFVTPDGTYRYNHPVVSLVTDERNLFDYDNGIYVPGRVADEWFSDNGGTGWNDGSPANYNQRGEEWEKKAHLEYFDGRAQPEFSQNVGIRIHGGWTRAYRMKSIRLYARDDYDEIDTFNYPFFGELPSRGNPDNKVTSFKRLILRNSGNDNHSTMYRDALVQDLVKHLPFSVQAYKPVVHFINGEYWGTINIRERYDKYYLESHYGVNADEVTILEPFGNVEEGDPADRDLFNEIVDYARSNNLFYDTPFQWVKSRVDVESLAQYYAVQIYIHNTDWPQNNMTFWRKQTTEFYEDAPRGHDGRWRWMLYDTDFGVGLHGSSDYVHNSLARVMDHNTSDLSSRLFQELMDNDGFRNNFINTLSDHLNSCFKPSNIRAAVNEFNATISDLRDEHYNRWRSGTDLGGNIATYGNNRADYLMTHVENEFNLPGHVTLTISRSGEGGAVKVNSLTLDETTPGVTSDSPYPWSGNYFEDVPVTLKALNTPGYRFSHWESNIDIDNPQSKEVQITLTQNADVSAVFEQEERQLIHYWDFNYLPDGILTPLSANYSAIDDPAILSYPGTGDGYMDRVSDGTVLNAHNNAPAERALRVRNPSNTRELIITLPSTGYEGVIMNYAVKRTTSGAPVQAIYYKTEENGDWSVVKDELLITLDYQLITVDFLNIEGADNNEHFAVRILFSGEGTSGTDGNNRFDNISFEGYRSTSSNITNASNDARVSIYPVPASETINIESIYQINLVYLYNIKGEIIRTITPYSNRHMEDISSLKPGYYFLDVKTEAGQTVQKIVVK